ncbi:MAG TPA: hypothetical protein VFR32_10515 [Gaiellaceae bacterium]|nr:hypothetical protein [Gaiellaceae bacterium]
MDRRLPGWTLPAAGIGIPLLAVLVAILALDPYYGVVDDAILLGYAQTAAADVPGEWADRVWSDVSGWGMVRPFYWGLAYVEYRIGDEGPAALYVLNWAVTGAVLAFAGFALARAFRVPSSRLGIFLAVYGAAVFVYPWTLDLFAFASYQEKWVVLAAALGLLWFAEPRDHLPAWGWYAVSALVIGLGSLTKAQFVVFLPAFCLLVLDHRREGRARWERVIAVTGMAIVAALALRAVAWQGDYTEGFGLSNVPDQLGSRYLWLVSAFALAWTIYALVPRNTILRDLVPTAVFVAFVFVFAQWPGGFLWTLLGFVAAGAFALAVSRLRSQALAATALAATLLWACTWIWVRTDELYSSLTSIGEFARSVPARTLAAEGVPVYISCEEGSAAIAGYVRREQGLGLSVRPQDAAPWTSAKGLEPPPTFRYALVDERLCPADVDSAKWRPVWTPSREGGFVLHERTPEDDG